MSLLLLLSSQEPGVSAKHFLQIHSVMSTVFGSIVVCTPNGDSICWNIQDEHTRKTLADKQLEPVDLKSIDFTLDWHGLVIPDQLGLDCDILFIFDYFIKFKRPICMIGSGTEILLKTRPKIGEDWLFKDTCMTGPSNQENSSVQDFISDFHGNYSFTRSKRPHIVIDDHIVTAQNKNSSLLAVQTFILLCSQ
ncbi:hypothetical protein EDD86DRAFT_194898 [Gorgonomyces haynaldii]|nr:hypothetical protein EDD86DRAFT_194898 [Gorgonomyces haynaldii]